MAEALAQANSPLQPVVNAEDVLPCSSVHKTVCICMRVCMVCMHVTSLHHCGRDLCCSSTCFVWLINTIFLFPRISRDLLKCMDFKLWNAKSVCSMRLMRECTELKGIFFCFITHAASVGRHGHLFVCQIDCLSVCLQHNSKQNVLKCSTWYREWPWISWKRYGIGVERAITLWVHFSVVIQGYFVNFTFILLFTSTIVLLHSLTWK